MILRMIDGTGRTTYIINLDRFNDFYVEKDRRVKEEPTVAGWFPNGGHDNYQTENIWTFRTDEEADAFLKFIGDCYADGKRCIDFYKETVTYEAR